MQPEPSVISDDSALHLSYYLVKNSSVQFTQVNFILLFRY